MKFLDPLVCEQARRLIAAGHTVAAVEALVQSPQPDHAAVQALRVECQHRLIAQATEALAHRESEAAREVLQVAERCGPLPVAGIRLKCRLETPQGKPSEGERGDSTIDYVPGESERTQPEPKMSVDPPQPITSRDQLVALGGHALVVSSPTALLGRSDKAHDTGAELPLQAQLHRRHAELRREVGRYRLARHSSHADLVAVNEQSIGDQPRILADDDLITMGSIRGSHLCTLRFRLPVLDNMTAILELDAPAIFYLASSQMAVRFAVLLDESIIIVPDFIEGASNAHEGHLKIAHLPCRQLVFRWTAAGLSVAVVGGTVCIVESGSRTEDCDPPILLFLPCRLRIDALPMDRLRFGAQGDLRAQPLFLELYDPRSTRP